MINMPNPMAFNGMSGPAQNTVAQAYQAMMQNQQQMQGNVCPIRIINDESEIYRFPTQAGQSVFFLNSAGTMMYLKSADMNNIPNPIRYFNITEIQNPNAGPQIASKPPIQATAEPAQNQVTRDEMNSVVEAVKAMQSSIDELKKTLE